MDVITKIHSKAKQTRKTIVLPEADEPRIKEAIKIIEKEGICKLVVLDKDKLESEKIKRFAEEFYQIRKHKGISYQDAENIVSQPLYYAGMMVRLGEVDGFVAGAAHTTPNVARAAIYCLGVDSNIGTASSSFIMIVPDCSYGESGIMLFADCGIVPEPSAKQLASIAISTAQLAKSVLDFSPRVAMLSYSTKGSSKGKCVDKVKEATEIVKQLKPDLTVEGELQADSAIVPEVAKIKSPDSLLAGRANILIFPDLEAGNISYKLVNRLAKARAIGPLLQGLNKPCSDLSRGCSVEDIVDCTAVTAIRAQRS